ncbi:unnamed protein product [Amoebophrya sp. A25]|nr:unnamed protein product [Amoebophrya sp. A25]|eukprot:GSA25T00017172001.1
MTAPGGDTTMTLQAVVYKMAKDGMIHQKYHTLCQYHAKNIDNNDLLPDTSINQSSLTSRSISSLFQICSMERTFALLIFHGRQYYFGFTCCIIITFSCKRYGEKRAAPCESSLPFGLYKETKLLSL